MTDNSKNLPSRLPALKSGSAPLGLSSPLSHKVISPPIAGLQKKHIMFFYNGLESDHCLVADVLWQKDSTLECLCQCIHDQACFSQKMIVANSAYRFGLFIHLQTQVWCIRGEFYPALTIKQTSVNDSVMIDLCRWQWRIQEQLQDRGTLVLAA